MKENATGIKGKIEFDAKTRRHAQDPIVTREALGILKNRFANAEYAYAKKGRSQK